MKISKSDLLLITYFMALISIVVAFFYSLFIIESPYIRIRLQNYTIERKTLTLGLTYFLKENFDHSYNERLRRIETQIEKQYFKDSMDMCLNERQVKESMVWDAIMFEDKDVEEKAKQIKLKSCPNIV